jgi:hypothetical protein
MMAEKIRGAWDSVIHWWPIVASAIGMLVSGAMWFQSNNDHFKALEQHLINSDKRSDRMDKNIEAIQNYLLNSHAATVDSQATPAYNVYHSPVPALGTTPRRAPAADPPNNGHSFLDDLMRPGRSDQQAAPQITDNQPLYKRR